MPSHYSAGGAVEQTLTPTRISSITSTQRQAIFLGQPTRLCSNPTPSLSPAVCQGLRLRTAERRTTKVLSCSLLGASGPHCVHIIPLSIPIIPYIQSACTVIVAVNTGRTGEPCTLCSNTIARYQCYTTTTVLSSSLYDAFMYLMNQCSIALSKLYTMMPSHFSCKFMHSIQLSC